MVRIFPSNYTKKLIDQDPNGIVDLEVHGCRTVNDYKDWSELSSEVKETKLTPEELEKYLNGELMINLDTN
ncbi:hypothetical protein CHCC14600_0224 [Bacillus licheniformis]|uniref:hypothetical protein n=1 Tax=Bacillus TaxID=1386 RepID=UPI0008FB88DF|nr:MULTISPECIES: hypothetical protein [Bacillus]PRS16403.1 hypothetical protein C6W27_08330 [Bacillus paralicheniformis]ARW41735.1 hypothetical protein S100141_00412 [Bacillus licheniformis]MCA1182496.1 hypothetical protein [Bacillus licheniformis]MEC0475006.1 hypothetical protein [Bacillus licheniformis]MEC3606332.1 hypothetical protein [Bacillus glycinifermentans]